MAHYFYLAPEILLPFSPLPSKEFELIRRKARDLWQDESRWSAASVTTYSGSYHKKQLDEATCMRLAQRVGQPQFQYKQTPLPANFAYSTLPYQAGSQEATHGKVVLNQWVTALWGNYMTLHTEAHQIWGSEALFPTPLDYKMLREFPGVKPKKPGYNLLLSYKTRGKNLLKQLRRQWDYESKFGSSEDSETDRYSDYGRKSVRILN
ncbi:uncharacterized protein C4orf51 homolog [Acomys russatus]|uniref:uncharacterized protein C4orf51 homolog n=1 Tax=Acomys russatus TaxID=60746 RepID=UPI0021E2AC52|nr:uncharacterized protein C4orf51 homolog [Acomys russatus]